LRKENEMQKQNTSAMLAFIACGLVGSAASVSMGQAGQYSARLVTVSGATLLENFIQSQSAVNDFIDADGDLIAGSFGSLVIDRLAPVGIPNPPAVAAPLNGFWGVTYRSVGSVRGFQELIDFGRTFDTTTGGPGVPDATGGIPAAAATQAFYNGTRYQAGNTAEAGHNTGNPGNSPVRANITAGPDQFRALWSGPGTPSTDPTIAGIFGGMTVDIAIVDVPGSWAARVTGGAPNASLTPTLAGYGDNPVTTRNKDGTPNGFGHKLAALGTANLFNPANPSSANADTLFDTPISWSPISPITNFGTGLTSIDQSDLRQLFSTGRRLNGENLVAVTRDSGSGTRNGFDNSVGNDPSFGVGENVGPFNNTATFDVVGPVFEPGNKGGNPRVEATVFNHRLAVGYVGPERGINQSWLGTGINNDINPLAEILSVRMDLEGGTIPVRPFGESIVNLDSPDSWRIGGPSVLVTFGDPRNETAADGGVNWPQYQWNLDSRPLRPSPDDCPPCNDPLDISYEDYKNATAPAAEGARPTTLRMRNKWAAEFVNNVTRSAENVVRVPGAPGNDFMPGQVLAISFVLPAAVDALPVLDGTVFVPQTANPVLRAFTVANSIYARNRFSFFKLDDAGRLPQRTALTGGNRYSHGLSGANDYRTQGGSTISGSAGRVPMRSKVAGDFNGDGLRDLNDAADLIAAWLDRNSRDANGLNPTAAWVAPDGTGAPIASGGIDGTPGTDAVIEILGDFDGDGNFGRVWSTTTNSFSANYSDARYWADGLAIDPATGKLNRYKGFKALDEAWANAGQSLPFIPTALATGKAYAPGDAAGDIIGTDLARRAKNWAPTSSNGVVDAFDIDYVYAQFKNNANSALIGVKVTDGEATWSNQDEAVTFDLSADLNGDLIVNQADVCFLVTNILGTCAADVNLDGEATAADLSIISANLGSAGGWAQGDLNGDGFVTAEDEGVFLGTTILCCPQDYNADGFLNLDDLGDFITDYYTVPAIPGGIQNDAPTYAGLRVGFSEACPNAGDAPTPYAVDAYRTNGYRVGFSVDGSNSCPLDPSQLFPNLDNLNDFITAYYAGCSCASGG
jgi:hypothetical protein